MRNYESTRLNGDGPTLNVEGQKSGERKTRRPNSLPEMLQPLVPCSVWITLYNACKYGLVLTCGHGYERI
jgi:hypothetical protein